MKKPTKLSPKKNKKNRVKYPCFKALTTAFLWQTRRKKRRNGGAMTRLFRQLRIAPVSHCCHRLVAL